MRHIETTEPKPTEDNHDQGGIFRNATKKTLSQVRQFYMSLELSWLHGRIYIRGMPIPYG